MLGSNSLRIVVYPLVFSLTVIVLLLTLIMLVNLWYEEEIAELEGSQDQEDPSEMQFLNFKLLAILFYFFSNMYVYSAS